MSRWLECHGVLSGVGPLSGEPTPEGSEGGQPFSDHPEHGFALWTVNLRDREDEDVPEIRDWFAELCARTRPTEASLELDTGIARYIFTWDTAETRLVLAIPEMYRAEMAAQFGVGVSPTEVPGGADGGTENG